MGGLGLPVAILSAALLRQDHCDGLGQMVAGEGWAGVAGLCRLDVFDRGEVLADVDGALAVGGDGVVSEAPGHRVDVGSFDRVPILIDDVDIMGARGTDSGQGEEAESGKHERKERIGLEG